jgi:hypothetical protein
VLGLAACAVDTGSSGGGEATASTSEPLAATLQNGWTNAPFSTRNAAFYFDPGSGIVHFSGAVSSGSPSLLFTLPSNLAPTATTYIPVDLCGGSNGRLIIGTNGSVTVDTPKYSDATCFTSLEGASFAPTSSGFFSSISLQNGWVPYNSANPPLVGLVGGAVRFKGAIRSGTGGYAFTLPPELAPFTTVYVPVDLCGATKGRLVVSPDGSVLVQAETAFTNAQCFTSLDGAWFVPSETTPLADSQFVALNLQNGWVTYGGQSTPVARNRGGIVQLKGAISGGTTNSAFTLPPSMWPTHDVYVPVDLCNAHKGRLTIRAATGEVDVYAAYTESFSDAQCFTSLEGVEYPIQGYDAACPCSMRRTLRAVPPGRRASPSSRGFACWGSSRRRRPRSRTPPTSRTRRPDPRCPWPSPAALEQLMALLNGTITQATIAQTFSPTFISQNPSLATTLKNLQSLGTCPTFTVQRINSMYSANVTLWCMYGSKPMTFTATAAAPYLVDSLTL